MNLISGLMALSHHFSKLNYPGAEGGSGSSETQIDPTAGTELGTGDLKEGFAGGCFSLCCCGSLVAHGCELGFVPNWVFFCPEPPCAAVHSDSFSSSCSSLHITEPSAQICLSFIGNLEIQHSGQDLHPHEYGTVIE